MNGPRTFITRRAIDSGRCCINQRMTVMKTHRSAVPARDALRWFALALAFGCNAKGAGEHDGARRGAQGEDFGNAAAGGDGAGGATVTDFGTSGTGSGTAGNPPVVATDGGQACATAASAAELEPVYLAFAFDVSGSMGKGDEPWHDKSLKWDPVVLATRGFFEDDASAGLTASLTFFPEDGDEDERCVQEAYAEPDVSMTALPSPAFGDAIDAIEPASEGDWRGGTPTAWVMRGTRAFALDHRQDHPGRYAIVLVTDGYPQSCDDADDTIEAVVAEVELARADEIATYVVGVENPPLPDAPDTLSDLHEIAAAGNTGQAFLIDTGDPARTSEAFKQAIDEIRATSISCALAIPEPPDGQTFDKEKVAVRYASGGAQATSFTYDDSCATASAWHYDDPADPRQIVLCESTCELVQSDPEASFEVEFACERLFSVD